MRVFTFRFGRTRGRTRGSTEESSPDAARTTLITHDGHHSLRHEAVKSGPLRLDIHGVACATTTAAAARTTTTTITTTCTGRQAGRCQQWRVVAASAVAAMAAATAADVAAAAAAAAAAAGFAQGAEDVQTSSSLDKLGCMLLTLGLQLCHLLVEERHLRSVPAGSTSSTTTATTTRTSTNTSTSASTPTPANRSRHVSRLCVAHIHTHMSAGRQAAHLRFPETEEAGSSRTSATTTTTTTTTTTANSLCDTLLQQRALQVVCGVQLELG